MTRIIKIGDEVYEVHHQRHNDRKYILYKDNERLGTYDNYGEIDEAIEELQKKYVDVQVEAK